jgi:hypothetical protein
MVLMPCGNCCQQCGNEYPYGDPADYGKWDPSGSWKTGVTWSYSSTGGDQWHFYGSAGTSGAGSIFDWMNPCNWWIHEGGSSPSGSFSATRRANGVPPDTATVFVHSQVSTTNCPGGVAVVARCYMRAALRSGASLSATGSWAPSDGTGGTVLAAGMVFTCTIAGGATFTGASFTSSGSTISGGATLNDTSLNNCNISGGATLNTDAAHTLGTITGGATLNDNAYSQSTINGGAVFNGSSRNTNFAVVNGGATLYGSARNELSATINGGATFYNTSRNSATVNGGATFQDAACTTTVISSKYVAHPTDLPTCSGTAPTYAANPAAGCGCG